MGLEFWKWRPYKVRSLVSNSIYAKKDRNGPPSANQVISRDKTRHGHAVCTLWVHQPTSPMQLFLLMQNIFQKDIAGIDIMKLMMLIGALGPKELMIFQSRLSGNASWV